MADAAASGGESHQLAERSGLSRRTLIEIEQGRTIGTLAIWHAVAHAFDVPLGDLAAALCDGHTPPAGLTDPSAAESDATT